MRKYSFRYSKTTDANKLMIRHQMPLVPRAAAAVFTAVTDAEVAGDDGVLVAVVPTVDDTETGLTAAVDDTCTLVWLGSVVAAEVAAGVEVPAV